MAKIVIAGAADCPHFAKVELLADELGKNTPNFHVHKIVLEPQEWESWRNSICSRYGWNVVKSPIVWRELVDRGGKGALIGGANEFLEYAAAYYGMHPMQKSQHLLNVAQDNLRFKKAVVWEERYLRSLSDPIRVCVTAASSNVAYHIFPDLTSGKIFGEHVELSLILFDLKTQQEPDVLETLKGVQMELFDLAQPLLRSITITNDFSKAVEGCHYVILLCSEEDGALLFPDDDDSPNEGKPTNHKKSLKETRRLQSHVNAMTFYGELIDQHAHKDCKILLASIDPENRTPLCFNMHHLLQSLQRINRGNVIGLSRGLERRVKTQLAQTLKVNPANVVDVIVWGDPSLCYSPLKAESSNVKTSAQNPSSPSPLKFKQKEKELSEMKYFVDVSHSQVYHFDGAITGPEFYHQNTPETIWDKKWLKKEFKSLYETRQSEIMKSRGNMSHGLPTMSTAHALSSCLRDWIHGNSESRQEIYSLCVPSQGLHGIPEGMVFSVPVRFQPPGQYRIVDDIDLTSEQEIFIGACIQAQKDLWNGLVIPEEGQDLVEEVALLQEVKTPPTPLENLSSLLNEYITTDNMAIIKPLAEKFFTPAEIEVFKHNGLRFKEICENMLPLPNEGHFNDLEELIQNELKPEQRWKLRPLLKVHVTEEEVNAFKDDPELFNKKCQELVNSV